MRNHSEPGRAAAHYSGVLNFELTAITGWDFVYFPLGKKWCLASVGTMVCRISGWTEGQIITGCNSLFLPGYMLIHVRLYFPVFFEEGMAM